MSVATLSLARLTSARLGGLTTGSARRQALVNAAPRPAAPRATRVQRRAMGAAASSGAGGDLVAQVQQKNADNAVMVYSKTYCPYCSEVKGLFERLGVAAKVVELDELADGSAVQDAVAQLTGRRTVPQVFVGGQHVGGCDDTMAAYNSGKLKQLLDAAGVQAKL